VTMRQLLRHVCYTGSSAGVQGAIFPSVDIHRKSVTVVNQQSDIGEGECKLVTAPSCEERRFMKINFHELRILML
jgi:hypothetical protein